MSKQVSINIGSPLFLVFLVFLTLKLTHHIDWSWVWVTAPLWMGFAVWVIFLFIILIFATIASCL